MRSNKKKKLGGTAAACSPCSPSCRASKMLGLLVPVLGALRFQRVPIYDLIRAYELEKAAFPADEAASLDQLRQRITEAKAFFWGAYDVDREAGPLLEGFICGTLTNARILTQRSMNEHTPGTYPCEI